MLVLPDERFESLKGLPQEQFLARSKEAVGEVSDHQD
jgi:hypothetical protein